MSQTDETPKKEYQGNAIPFVIKFVWVVLILWAIYYSFEYAVPDLKFWLSK